MRARCLLALGLVLGAGAPGGEEEARARLVSVRPALGMRAPLNAWVPMAARVANPTSKPLYVTVDVECPTGPDTTRFGRKTLVPPGTERRVELFGRVDYPVTALRYQFQERDGADAPVMTFADGVKRRQSAWRVSTVSLPSSLWSEDGRLLGRDAATLLPAHPDSLGLIGIDVGAPEVRELVYRSGGLPRVFGESPKDTVEPGTPRDLEGSRAYVREAEPPAALVGRLVAAPAFVSARDLPTRWAAYEGVDTLVLGNARAGGEGLSATQRWALARYVRSGGRLVIVPAADPGAYDDPAWDALMPAAVAGLVPATAALPALAAFSGGEAPPVEPEAWFAELLPTGATETMTVAAGRVLAASRRIGAGSVWLVALPAEAVKTWSGAYRLWTEPLRPTPSPLPGVDGAVAESAVDLLAGEVGAKAPGRLGIAIVLSVYFFAGAGMLWFFRRRGAGERGWLAVLALAVAGGALVALLGRVTRGSSDWVVGEIGFTTLHSGEGEGTSSGFVGMYSPVERRGDWVWTNPDTLAAPLADFARMDMENPAAAVRSVLEDTRFSQPGMTVKPGEMVSARAMTLARFGDGVAVTVAWGPEGPRGEVENRTGSDLDEVQFRIGRRVYRLGDLAGGQRIVWSDRPWTPGMGPLWSNGEAELRRRRILAEALRIDAEGSMGLGGRNYAMPPTAYGWRRRPESRMAFGDEAPPLEHAAQLLAVTAAVEAPAGSKILVPEGTCGVRLLGHVSNQAQMFGDPLRPPRPGREAPPPGKARAPRSEPPKRVAVPGGPDIFEEDATAAAVPDYSRRWEETGWHSGDMMPAPARLAFVLPEGLERLRPERLTLRVEVSATGLLPRLRVRRPDAGALTAGWSDLKLESMGKGEATLEWSGDDLAKWSGPQGELPEWELAFRAADALATTGQTPLRWNVKKFDIEVEGTLPER